MNSFEFILFGGLLIFLNLQVYLYICICVCFYNVWEGLSLCFFKYSLGPVLFLLLWKLTDTDATLLSSSPKALGRCLCFNCFSPLMLRSSSFF